VANKWRYFVEYPRLDLYCCKLERYSSEAANSSILEVVAHSGSTVVDLEASTAGFGTLAISCAVEIATSVAMKSRFQLWVNSHYIGLGAKTIPGATVIASSAAEVDICE